MGGAMCGAQVEHVNRSDGKMSRSVLSKVCDSAGRKCGVGRTG